MIDIFLKSTNIHPEMASCGPYLRSRNFEILDVAALSRQRRDGFKIAAVVPAATGLGVDLNHNLPFLDGHSIRHTVGVPVG